MPTDDADFAFDYIGNLLRKGKIPYIKGYFFNNRRQHICFFSKSHKHNVITPKRIPGMKDRQFKRHIRGVVEEVNTLFTMYEL